MSIRSLFLSFAFFLISLNSAYAEVTVINTTPYPVSITYVALGCFKVVLYRPMEQKAVCENGTLPPRGKDEKQYPATSYSFPGGTTARFVGIHLSKANNGTYDDYRKAENIHDHDVIIVNYAHDLFLTYKNKKDVKCKPNPDPLYGDDDDLVCLLMKPKS